MYERTFNVCLTLFVATLLFGSYAYGLTADEEQLILELASKANLSNSTLLVRIFNSTTGINATQNVTVLVNNDTYNRTQIDNFFANQSKSITDVNSSVNLEIIKLLNAYQNASVEIATGVADERVNKTLPNVIEQFDSLIRSLDSKFATKTEVSSSLQNTSLQLRAAIGTSESFIRKDMNGNTILLILGIILGSAGSAAAMYFLTKRRIDKIPKNFVVNMRATKPLSSRVGSIDEITSNETIRQRRLRLIELKNYCLKQKLHPWIKLQVVKMINSSELDTKDDVNKAIETLKLEMSTNGKA